MSSSNSVLISTPTKGNIHALTARWRLRTVLRLAQNPQLGVIPGVDTVITPKPLEHARNVQVHNFLKSGYDYLFLLDSDCVPQMGTLVKLLEIARPIVSAPHEAIVQGERGLMVVDKVEDGYVQHRPMQGLQGPNVRVGGSGLLIHKEVFEKLQPPWFVCEYDANGLLSLSEDFYFCERALDAGYEIWAQCDLWQRHICR